MSNLHHYFKWSPAVLLSFVVLILSACGGGGSGESGNVSIFSVRETSLNYGNVNLVLTVGKTITPIAPDAEGERIIGYSVTPTLPAGLILDTTTGIVSGTPSSVSPYKMYTITGTYSGGSVTTGLEISVQATVAPPFLLTYSCVDCIFLVGETILPLEPSVLGGQPTRFISQKALPPGIILDPISGVISGTPTVPVARDTYSLIASNEGGESQTFIFTLEVKDDSYFPTAESQATKLSYGEKNVYEFNKFKGLPITPLIPSYTGAQCEYFGVSPDLPFGLSFSTGTGEISGTPIELKAATEYTVTCYGKESSATATVVLTISVTDRAEGFINGNNFYYDGQYTWTKITTTTFNYEDAANYCKSFYSDDPAYEWQLPGFLHTLSLWQAVGGGKLAGQGWYFDAPGIWVEPSFPRKNGAFILSTQSTEYSTTSFFPLFLKQLSDTTQDAKLHVTCFLKKAPQ